MGAASGVMIVGIITFPTGNTSSLDIENYSIILLLILIGSLCGISYGLLDLKFSEEKKILDRLKGEIANN